MMTDLLILAMAVGVIAIAFLLDRRIARLERAWDEIYDAIALLAESPSPTNEQTSNTQPPEQVTLDEMVDDTLAHGGHARSVDYFANLDRDTPTRIASYAMAHHVFSGSTDRDCLLCGLPDRSDVHRGFQEASWFVNGHVHTEGCIYG